MKVRSTLSTAFLSSCAFLLESVMLQWPEHLCNSRRDRAFRIPLENSFHR